MIPVNFRHYALAISVCVASIASTTVVALPSDRLQETRASAEKVVFDQKKGIATYTGAVKVQQGSLIVTADSIVIETNADGSVKKMTATGQPAQFQQQPEKDQGVITASASNITYTPDKKHLLLVDNASLEQDGAVMSGPRIDYDLVKEVMRAAGNNNGTTGERIEIVIPPKTETTTE